MSRHYNMRQVDDVLVIQYFEPFATVGTHIGPHWFADVAVEEKELAERMVEWLNQQDPLPDTVRPAPGFSIDPNKFA